MLHNEPDRVSALFSRFTLVSELVLADPRLGSQAKQVGEYALPYFRSGLVGEFKAPEDANLETLSELAKVLRIKNGNILEDSARIATVYSQSVATVRKELIDKGELKPEQPDSANQLGKLLEVQRERIKAAMTGLTEEENILKSYVEGDPDEIKAKNADIFIHNMAVILLGSSIALPEEK